MSLLPPEYPTGGGIVTSGTIYSPSVVCNGGISSDTVTSNTVTVNSGNGIIINNSGNTVSTTLKTSATSSQIINLPITSSTDTILTNTSTSTVSNKSLLSSSVLFVDSTDSTKKLEFVLSGITTGTTRSWTLANTNDTFVGLTSTQTLTNKTLTAPTISTITNGGTITVPSGTLTLATLTGTETFTNKSLGGMTTVTGNLFFNDQTAIKMLALYDNDTHTDQTQHRFFGFGISANTLRYHVDAASSSHVFYSATSATASTELFRINNTTVTSSKSMTITPTTNQIVLGTTNTTTLNAPAPASSIVITYPTVAGTLATLAGTETFTNKTLTAPAITSPVITTALTATGTISLNQTGSVDTNIGSATSLTRVRGRLEVGGLQNASSYCYITGDIGAGSSGGVSGLEVVHTNLTQGIGMGYNTIYGCGSNTNHDLGITAKGTTGAILLNSNVTIASAKNLAMSGASTFTTGTGAIALNGTTTTAILRCRNFLVGEKNGQGALINGLNCTSAIYIGAGSISQTAGSFSIIGVDTNFPSTCAGGALYINNSGISTITSWVSATEITITTNSGFASVSDYSIHYTASYRLHGSVTQSTDHTFSTGTGAVSLNGNTTIASGKTLTISALSTLGILHNSAAGLISSSLIVNADVDASAAIADTKLATITTAGKVSNSATTATSANTASAIVARDANGFFQANDVTLRSVTITPASSIVNPANQQGIGLKIGAISFSINDTTGAGTVGNFAISSVGQATLTATNPGRIYSTASSFYISGAPILSTNVSGNAYALMVGSGTSRFDGSINLTAGITTTGTSAITFSDDAVATTVKVGTGAAAKTVTLGSTTSTSTTTINAGSGNINLNGTTSTKSLIFTTETLTANGAISIALYKSIIDSRSGSITATLADGTVDQEKQIKLLSKRSAITTVTCSKGSFDLTPYNNDRTLRYTSNGWLLEGREESFYVTTQQGNKLVGTGNTGAAEQGRSIALSADGNTLAIGGYKDNSNQGAVWIFTRSGTTWSQEGNKLVGTGNTGAAQQGYSIALSADGNTLAVGGNTDNTNQGAVWIFTRSGTTWTQQGDKLSGTGGSGSIQQQGSSVSLSADGNTLAVGAEGDNSSVDGATWVFTRSGGTWTQQGNKLVGTGFTGTPRQGYSVSLSADGNTLASSGPYDNSTQGAVWIFTRSGTTWAQEGNKLVGTGNTGAANQGVSISLSADGNTLAIGGSGDNSLQGAVWIFTRSGTSWTQQGNKLVGTGNTSAANQGWAVSLSADGNTLVTAGVTDNSNQGAVWIFTRDNTRWTQKNSKLVGTGNTGAARQGWSISINSNGNTLAFGGYSDNTNQGAAWIYI